MHAQTAETRRSFLRPWMPGTRLISMCAWTSCLCTLSASAFMHWAIRTWGRFLFRKFGFVSDKSLLTIKCTTHTLAVDVSSAHVCWQMASNSQYTLPPQSLPQENASGKSQLRSKQSSKGPLPENFLTIGGCFECYTYRIKVLGWLKKERKKMNNSDFRLFQVCHFKIVATHCYYYCRLGQAL